MHCFKCQRDFDSVDGRCPFCGQQVENDVRVLTPEEKEKYDGVTIESDGSAYEEKGGQNQQPGRRVYVKQIRMGRSGWASKLALYFFIAALAMLVIFFLIPTALIAVGVGVLIWFILGFFR